MDKHLCLIVDDESAIRSYLSVILRNERIQSLEAESAVEALRILHKLGDEIDLLITDIQMPGDMDGVDLAYSAKNLLPFLPVILMSGFAEKAPNGFAFVSKPFQVDQILNAIEKAMTKTRAGGAR
jgi:DNA-binding NtrC family response regulator